MVNYHSQRSGPFPSLHHGASRRQSEVRLFGPLIVPFGFIYLYLVWVQLEW